MPAARSPGGQEQASRITAELSGLAKPGEPGFAILVRGHGATVFEAAYGVRDLRSKKPIDANTNFRLASCTKQFTAMAIMLLVHDGKLRYEQTLGSIWPDFPEYGRGITIRQLLNHTSGLPDYEDLRNQSIAELKEENKPSPRENPPFDFETSGRLERTAGLAQISDSGVLLLLKRAQAGKFASGTRWSYSNSGYVLLGLVVAQVSGQPFPKFLRDRIFGPLHMDSSVAHVNGADKIANRAYGHTKTGNEFRETDQSPTSATLGDGGIYSNLNDLAKWDEALRNDTLLSEEEMRPALTPAVLADGSQPHWPADPGDNENLHPGKPVSYGFGWFLDPYKVPGTAEGMGLHARMWHYGSSMGFRSAIERYTEQPLTVIVLCNRTDLDPQQLAHRVADLIPPLK
jgi:CubicO group peptidase (beta-lactamase class C family)